ncbi:MAG: IS66 family transposase, partial [Acidobacteriota bacterium]
MVDIEAIDDPEQLRTVCKTYEASHRILVDRLETLAKRIAELEGVDAAQTALDLPDLQIGKPDEPVAEPPQKRSRESREPRRGHGPTPQPELPIEVIEHRFDTSPECPACGEGMTVWLGQFEESEEITVVETSFKVSCHRRVKYRCTCHGAVATAPGPPKLIPGGRYSIDFAVHTAVEKFCDHIPLARQSRRMERDGLSVTTQTLWDQQAALARHLEPTWQHLWDLALLEDILHVDETGWRLMGSKSKPNWTLFGLTAPHLAVYHLASSKSVKATREILSGFKGTLVVDGYKVYPIVAGLEKSMRIAHCWAHTDRKFKDAKDPPRPISEIRGLIAELYEIEREVRGPFPGDPAAQEARHRLRRKRSSVVLEKIREVAFSHGGLRRSAFGKALRYLLTHWDGLTLFLEDPRIALDNNAAERVLRGPVVGRKNFYGNRSKRGAKGATAQSAVTKGDFPDFLKHHRRSFTSQPMTR